MIKERKKNTKNKKPLFSKMEQKNKKLKKPQQFCLTCYKCGHETSLCYRLKKETKKKAASPDKEILISEYVNHKVCEIQFGNYDLLVTNYLCGIRQALEMRRSEYMNSKLCEVQHRNYDDRMKNYLLTMCD